MIEEFHYRIGWRSHSAHPGLHLSSQSGGEQEFYGHAPLMARPEAHNIDIHASLLDPFGQFVVRTFKQRSIINVVLIADLSASMGFGDKMAAAARFAESAAYSAYRSGDYFGFIGCREQLLPEFYYPARWYKGGLPELALKLRAHTPEGRDCKGIIDSAEHLPKQRCLVLLLSDFHFPLADIALTMDALLKHDVVPVVLWQQREYDAFPEWGLLRLQDLESGHSRPLLMRPSLKAKIRRQFAERRQQLQHLFSRYGRQPFFIAEPFRAEQFTRYFHEQ
ncbi:MAG: DUF58 domain-containing protein [Gammaproteobacteria bacterium]